MFFFKKNYRCVDKIMQRFNWLRFRASFALIFEQRICSLFFTHYGITYVLIFFLFRQMTLVTTAVTHVSHPIKLQTTATKQSWKLEFLFCYEIFFEQYYWIFNIVYTISFYGCLSYFHSVFFSLIFYTPRTA